jgi:exosortase D (VPLPA-CTERM-specific)
MIAKVDAPYWRFSVSASAELVALLILTVAVFRESLSYLLRDWLTTEEYSHGTMIPLVVAFLIWQKKSELARIPPSGCWRGVALAGLGLSLFAVAQMATLYVVEQYAFLMVLYGAILAICGPALFRRIGAPLLFLFFAIPLPEFLYRGLSGELQLISSRLGVSFIRLCDISVFLEGNVIDLGAMKLQVAEACNGLRYLFPLTSVAFICAYLYRAEFWKRAAVFLSSIPLTVLMNSFRIGVIGVLVEYWGKSMAEGFLHDFEGWIVFMGCAAILAGEMWLLARIGRSRRPLREVFGLEFPPPWPTGTRFQARDAPIQSWAVGALLLAAWGLTPYLEQREEIVPTRAMFSEFPMRLGDWTGQQQKMEQEYVDALKFEDYILADFTAAADPLPVNLYSAYYASQRKGESIHSPRSCLPAGGWEMRVSGTLVPPGFEGAEPRFMLNRVLIQKGESRQLVYYWFRQRGRNITSEYLAKFYLFWDALTRNRTDGALIRLTTPVPTGDDVSQADRRLADFLRAAEPLFKRFIAD